MARLSMPLERVLRSPDLRILSAMVAGIAVFGVVDGSLWRGLLTPTLAYPPAILFGLTLVFGWRGSVWSQLLLFVSFAAFLGWKGAVFVTPLVLASHACALAVARRLAGSEPWLLREGRPWHSCVRETLSIGFPGGAYEQLFYVADVRIARGFDRDLYINLGKQVLTLMFPVRSSGMQRLIGLVPPDLSQQPELTFEHLRRQIEAQLDISVTDVNWFTTYRVHHRVADRFRVGRAFLLGDAGHIHSPAGGQGMNTGIGDAINLAWKLAHVLDQRADASLLDTYEAERIEFARSLVSTTDRAFTPMVAEGFRGEITRRLLAPLFMTAATRFVLSRHALFRVISQMRIHYPDSPLSEGKAGEVQGGDRLSWIGACAQDNFAPLRSLDWQLHVYGTITHELATACRELGLPVQTFVWSQAADNGGIQRNAAYLVRSDGHVALASPEQSVTVLKTFIDRWGMRLTAEFSSGG